MRVICASLIFVALGACAPSAPQPAPMVVASDSGMFEVKLGTPFDLNLDGASTPLEGVAIFDAPVPAGALLETFYDYSVQVDTESKQAIAVSARRTFSTYGECSQHLARVLPHIRAKYAFESQQESPAASRASLDELRRTLIVLPGQTE